MHPYRPLHALRPPPPVPPPRFELRGLALVLVLILTLRLVPLIARAESVGAPTVIALAAFALCVLELSSIGRRLRRWIRRRWSSS